MILRPSVFEHRVDDIAPDAAVHHLSGRLYGTMEGYAFQEAIHRRARESLKVLILDFSRIERIDSCGIGILASILTSMRNANGRLILAAIPPPIAKLLDTVWFLRIVDHCASVDEARRLAGK